MKKLVSLATLALTLATWAAPQKLLEVVVNDRATILNQATKLAEMTGVPMVGLAAVGLLAQNPLAVEFGAPRDGAMTTITVWGDPDVLSSEADLDAFEKSVRVAAAYPSVDGKAVFAKKGVTPTNGVFAVDDRFVTFSADGKWSVIGNRPEGLTDALAEAGKATLTQGELVRSSVSSAGLDLLRKLHAIVSRMGILSKESRESMDAVQDLLQQFASLSLSLRLSDMGIDVMADYAARPESELARIGRVPFVSPDPFAFAGKEALIASATAAGSGSGYARRQYEALEALAKKYAPPAAFLSQTKTERELKLELDMKALVGFLRSDAAEKWFGSLFSDEAFEKDLSAVAEKPMAFKAEGPESACAFSLKGVTLATTPSDRFARALGEVKGKGLYFVKVSSLYAFLRKASEAAMEAARPSESLDASSIAMVRDVLKTLPAETEGCFAIACWREGERHELLVRATPDEVKGISAFVKLVWPFISQGVQGADGGTFGEELPADEDED